MAMSGTLQVVGNVIQNQPVTCVLTVSNSGGANVNVNSVQARFRPGNGPFIATTVVVPAGQAVSQVAGSQSAVTVAAGGAAVFTFQVVALGPTVGTGQLQQGSTAALVSADVSCSDGSVFATPGQWVAPAGPQFGQPPGSPPNARPGLYGGEMQFNQSSNSALAL